MMTFPAKKTESEKNYAFAPNENKNSSSDATQRKMTYFNSPMDRKPLALKGVKKSSLANDVIEDFSSSKMNWKLKFKMMIKVYLFPNILAILFTCVVKAFMGNYPIKCPFPPTCICLDLTYRFIFCLQDLLTYWMMWIILILLEIYQKLCRFITLALSVSFIFIFYFCSEAQGFSWAGIYSFLLLLRFFRLLLINKSRGWKILWNSYCYFGSSMLLMLNYLFFLFLAQKIQNEIKRPWIDIFYSFYFLFFFLVLKHSLVNFGMYSYHLNYQNQQQNFLLVSGARISLSYCISFMTAPFLKFQLQDPSQYLVIFSYCNNLISLYTRFNFFQFIFLKIWYRLKNPKIFPKNNVKNTEKEEKSIEKIISGCTLDITFINSIRLIIYHFWPGNLLYSNCVFEESNLAGILILIFINLILAISIFIFMIKKGKALFSYRGKLNPYVNTYLLFLTNILCELNISFYMGKF